LLLHKLHELLDNLHDKLDFVHVNLGGFTSGLNRVLEVVEMNVIELLCEVVHYSMLERRLLSSAFNPGVVL